MNLVKSGTTVGWNTEFLERCGGVGGLWVQG